SPTRRSCNPRALGQLSGGPQGRFGLGGLLQDIAHGNRFAPDQVQLQLLRRGGRPRVASPAEQILVVPQQVTLGSAPSQTWHQPVERDSWPWPLHVRKGDQ